MKKTIIDRTIQILLGGVFLFSGLLKGMDIYGTMLKLSEYARQMDFPWIEEYSQHLAIVLCGVEIFIGLWMVTFLYRKVAIALLIGMTAFFSALNLYFIIDPSGEIADCGCFGDLFPLTMEESLLKNVCILALASYLLWSIRNRCTSHICDAKVHIITLFLLTFFFTLLGSQGTGLFNPTGYNTGVNLREKNDFMVLNDDYEEITDSLLCKSEKLYIIVLKKELSYPEQSAVRTIYDHCKKDNASCFALSDTHKKLPRGVECYYADAILLKSLVRSPENGYLLLRNGEITEVELLTNSEIQ